MNVPGKRSSALEASSLKDRARAARRARRLDGGTRQKYTYRLTGNTPLHAARRHAVGRHRGKDGQQSRDGESLIAMISHDMRTPLGGMLSILSVLDGQIQDTHLRKAVHLAQASGEHLRLLLDGLIDKVHLDSGSLRYSSGPVHLPNLVEECARFWEIFAADKGLAMTVRTKDLPAWVEADRTRIRQVLDNLLSNAVKYTRKGNVTLEMKHESGALSIAVTDTGGGLSPEECRRVFKRFHRLDRDKAAISGSGLGLFICKHIVSLAGGEMGVDQVPGGSRFYARIPCAVLTSNPMGSGEGDPICFSQPLTIVVADDLKVNRLLIAGQVRKMGGLAKTAEDGEEAIALLVKDGADVLLIDQSMPVMSGTEAVRALRCRTDRLANLPIVIITGVDSPANRAALMRAGADAVVAKPATSADLLSAISTACAVRSSKSAPR